MTPIPPAPVPISGNQTVVEKNVTIDVTPPTIELIADDRYVNFGGVYRGSFEDEECAVGWARTIAERIGFDAREVEIIGDLVRWHLLLPETATTRDPDDPGTVETITSRIHDREELELLAADVFRGMT